MSIGYTRVILPIGEITYPRCVADLFVSRVLTISSIDDNDQIREFHDGEWLRAAVYGDDGHLLHELLPSSGTLSETGRVA